MPEEIVDPLLPEQSADVVLGAEAAEERSAVSLETEPQQETALERGSEQYSKILSQVQADDEDTDEVMVESDAQIVGALEEAGKQAHKLVELAEVKGVAHAVRVARRMNDLYVLDTMHDELADKLYDGLLAKGLITKE